ncbi:taurine transporter subunit; membrane component of ABC superfamily [Candidatus Hydrogenisulfobacillus filiaventi]|uniref:Taurine transporter subunit membrane component of ABC superfamily n=1 Tax=Candidatus Hydrogenisulfobacillus filiaventi TaxID=2707344 RepID=A0A6F8ZKP4_9FIRM|nr:ABC transporter permease [Bacillota bacterium]CAB1130182.1 taurine transporter subunit; membrane component of ABC superfamily [Candidatus Hydrogenisulfobacillus filiaventi]
MAVPAEGGTAGAAASPAGQPGTAWRARLPSLGAVLVLVGAWQVVAAAGWFPTYVLPGPARVLRDFLQLATAGWSGSTLWGDLGASVLRILLGFGAAVLAGVPAGLLMAVSPPVHRLADPLLQLARPVPPLAYIPLLILWFGFGELPKVLLIMLGTLPVVVLATVSGVRATPQRRLQVAQCLGGRPGQVFRLVVLPSALPEVLTGMRVGIGVAWTCLVAAEMFGASRGLGWLIQYAGHEIRTGLVFVGIVAIGAAGYAMDLGLRLLERVLVPWKGRE